MSFTTPPLLFLDLEESMFGGTSVIVLLLRRLLTSARSYREVMSRLEESRLEERLMLWHTLLPVILNTH